MCALPICLPPGCFSPSKYGARGCIPAVVKSAVGSVSLGTREEEGIIICPCLLKNSKNFFLISLERMRQQRDLNPRPTVYKTVALPLSYAGVIFILTVVSPLAPPCGVNYAGLSSFLSLESAALI